MIVCPYCEQDYICYVSMRPFPHEILKVCFECSTIWESDENVGNDTGKGIKSFQKEIGVAFDWKKFSTKKLALLE